MVERDAKREEALAGLLEGTLAGGLMGIGVGVASDNFGLIESPVAEGATRYVSGNAHIGAESIGAQKEAHAYLKGEFLGSLLGLVVQTVIHLTQNKTGLDPYGLVGTITAAAFAHAENLGGMVGDFRDRIKKDGVKDGCRSFRKSPYQQGNALAIATLIIADATARANGFYPDTNTEAGLETSIAGPADSIVAGVYARWRLRRINRPTTQREDP